MAEQSSPSDSKHTTSELLWELAQSFSDEAQAAAKKRAIELGYPLDRGEIPFEETLINLSRNRDVLLKSVEDSAVPLLPLKIQNGLVADARKVSTQLTAMVAGTDAVVSFESAVDDLTASIWYSNLQNMSGQVLNLQEKLNQLKTLERTLRELGHRADSFRLAEEAASSGLTRLEEALKAVAGSADSLSSSVSGAQQQFDLAKETEQKVSAVLASVQQSEKSSAESAATTRASSGEVDSIKTRASTALSEIEETRASYAALTTEISKFKVQVETALQQAQDQQKQSYEELDKRSQGEFSRLSKSAEEKETALNLTITTTLSAAVEAFRAQGITLTNELRSAESGRAQASAAQIAASKSAFEAEASKLIEKNKGALSAAENKAQKIIDESEVKTSERFAELLKLEDIIREKIRLATNFQLFHAFQTRQIAIAESKDFWQRALFGFVGFSFLLAVAFITYLFIGHPTYDAAFYLKLSISFPLVYAIHFCSREYSKERKLEEEYAFKGNISISLEPYRELVEKMINKNDPVEAAKYSDFVIASIDKVFTSPMQQVFGVKEANITADGVAENSKELTKILGSINDLIQSLAKFK